MKLFAGCRLRSRDTGIWADHTIRKTNTFAHKHKHRQEKHEKKHTRGHGCRGLHVLAATKSKRFPVCVAAAANGRFVVGQKFYKSRAHVRIHARTIFLGEEGEAVVRLVTMPERREGENTASLTKYNAQLAPHDGTRDSIY